MCPSHMVEVKIKLDNVNNALSAMPDINSRHSVNGKHYCYCDFLFHVIIRLLSKLVSLG